MKKISKLSQMLKSLKRKQPQLNSNMPLNAFRSKISLTSSESYAASTSSNASISSSSISTIPTIFSISSQCLKLKLIQQLNMSKRILFSHIKLNNAQRRINSKLICEFSSIKRSCDNNNKQTICSNKQKNCNNIKEKQQPNNISSNTLQSNNIITYPTTIKSQHQKNYKNSFSQQYKDYSKYSKYSKQKLEQEIKYWSNINKQYLDWKQSQRQQQANGQYKQRNRQSSQKQTRRNRSLNNNNNKHQHQQSSTSSNININNHNINSILIINKLINLLKCYSQRRYFFISQSNYYNQRIKKENDSSSGSSSCQNVKAKSGKQSGSGSRGQMKMKTKSNNQNNSNINSNGNSPLNSNHKHSGKQNTTGQHISQIINHNINQHISNNTFRQDSSNGQGSSSLNLNLRCDSCADAQEQLVNQSAKLSQSITEFIIQHHYSIISTLNYIVKSQSYNLSQYSQQTHNNHNYPQIGLLTKTLTQLLIYYLPSSTSTANTNHHDLHCNNTPNIKINLQYNSNSNSKNANLKQLKQKQRQKYKYLQRQNNDNNYYHFEQYKYDIIHSLQQLLSMYNSCWIYLIDDSCLQHLYVYDSITILLRVKQWKCDKNTNNNSIIQSNIYNKLTTVSSNKSNNSIDLQQVIDITKYLITKQFIDNNRLSSYIKQTVQPQIAQLLQSMSGVFQSNKQSIKCKQKRHKKQYIKIKQQQQRKQQRQQQHHNRQQSQQHHQPEQLSRHQEQLICKLQTNLSIYNQYIRQFKLYSLSWINNRKQIIELVNSLQTILFKCCSIFNIKHRYYRQNQHQLQHQHQDEDQLYEDEQKQDKHQLYYYFLYYYMHLLQQIKSSEDCSSNAKQQNSYNSQKQQQEQIQHIQQIQSNAYHLINQSINQIIQSPSNNALNTSIISPKTQCIKLQILYKFIQFHQNVTNNKQHQIHKIHKTHKSSNSNTKNITNKNKPTINLDNPNYYQGIFDYLKYIINEKSYVTFPFNFITWHYEKISKIIHLISNHTNTQTSPQYHNIYNNLSYNLLKCTITSITINNSSSKLSSINRIYDIFPIIKSIQNELKRLNSKLQQYQNTQYQNTLTANINKYQRLEQLKELKELKELNELKAKLSQWLCNHTKQQLLTQQQQDLCQLFEYLQLNSNSYRVTRVINKAIDDTINSSSVNNSNSSSVNSNSSSNSNNAQKFNEHHHNKPQYNSQTITKKQINNKMASTQSTAQQCNQTGEQRDQRQRQRIKQLNQKAKQTHQIIKEHNQRAEKCQFTPFLTKLISISFGQFKWQSFNKLYYYSLFYYHQQHVLQSHPNQQHPPYNNSKQHKKQPQHHQKDRPSLQSQKSSSPSPSPPSQSSPQAQYISQELMNIEYLRRYILNQYTAMGINRRQIPTHSYFYKILQYETPQKFYQNYFENHGH